MEGGKKIISGEHGDRGRPSDCKKRGVKGRRESLRIRKGKFFQLAKDPSRKSLQRGTGISRREKGLGGKEKSDAFLKKPREDGSGRLRA